MNIESWIVIVDKPTSLQKCGELGIKLTHICENSYIARASLETIHDLVSQKLIGDATQDTFPTSPFAREYEYVGDVPVGKDIVIDLGLRKKDANAKYHLSGEIPTGLLFFDGKILGSPQEASDICHFEVTAISTEQNLTKQYMIRSFAEKCSSRTFTHKEYIQVGCGSQLVDYDPNGCYYRLVQPLPMAEKSPFLYAMEAALLIQMDAKNKDIVLFCSGGIDSQCMIQAFQSARVGFKAVFLKDTRGLNEMDYQSATEFFKKSKIPFEIADLDFKQFIDNYSYLSMANRYRFNNPEYGILLSLMDRYANCYPVYAGRPISVGHTAERDQVLGMCGDETWSKARYLERNKRRGCTEFLIYTPELMSGFLNLPIVRDFPRGQRWTYQHKLELLRQGGFNIESAPPIKYTGFEELFPKYSGDKFGNFLWTKHRGPLKERYPNVPVRNAISIGNGKLTDDGLRLFRSHPDGFGWNYLAKNDYRQYH